MNPGRLYGITDTGELISRVAGLYAHITFAEILDRLQSRTLEHVLVYNGLDHYEFFAPGVVAAKTPAVLSEGDSDDILSFDNGSDNLSHLDEMSDLGSVSSVSRKSSGSDAADEGGEEEAGLYMKPKGTLPTPTNEQMDVAEDPSAAEHWGSFARDVFDDHLYVVAGELIFSLVHLEAENVAFNTLDDIKKQQQRVAPVLMSAGAPQPRNPVGRPQKPQDQAARASKEKPRRRFHESWAEHLPWLRYMDGKMFCDLCVTRGARNLFVTGTKDLTIQVVRRHAKDCHLKDIVAFGVAPPQAAIVTGFAKQLENERERLHRLLRQVYYLSKSRTALWQFSNLCHLADLQELPIGTSYRTHLAANDFLICLSEAVLEEWLPAAKASPVFGIMIDESTTVSSEGKLIIYLRFMRHGRVFTQIWKLLHIDKADADSIFTSLSAELEDEGFDVSRCVSMSTDGASTMLGEHEGVAVRCRRAWNGVLLIVHCIAHRGALCVAHAASDNPAAQTTEMVVRSILSYHAHSNQRKSALAAMQDQLGVRELVLLTYHNVRWLSRAAVVNRILHNFAPLAHEFKADAAAEPSRTALDVSPARGLLNSMTTHYFVTSMCGFADVLKIMAQLSKQFQTRIVRYSNVTAMLNSTCSALQTLYTNIKDEDSMGGEHAKELADAMRSKLVDKTFIFRGIQIHCAPTDHRSAVADVKRMAGEILKQVKERFPSHAILEHLQIFDPRNLPTVLAGYGEQQISGLMAYFGKPVPKHNTSESFPPLVQGSTFKIEWLVFRQHLADWYQKYKTTNSTLTKLDDDVMDFYAELFVKGLFPEVQTLAAVWLCQCLSTVECERGFSVMALVKSKLRNKMNHSTLNAHMQIMLNGPGLSDHADVQRLVVHATEIFLRRCKRNVNKSHPRIAGRKPKVRAPEFTNVNDDLVPIVVRLLRDEPIENLDGRAGGHDDDEEEDLESALHDAEKEPDMNLEQQVQIFKGLPAYAPPLGRFVLPAPSPAEWVIPSSLHWTNRRIVHKWDDGWYEGTFKGATDLKNHPNMYEVYYQGRYNSEPHSTFRESRYHSLDLQYYGYDNLWLIVQIRKASAEVNVPKSAGATPGGLHEGAAQEVGERPQNGSSSFKKREPPTAARRAAAVSTSSDASTSSNSAAAATTHINSSTSATAAASTAKTATIATTMATDKVLDDLSENWHRGKSAFHGKLDASVRLPDKCLVVVFDVEHTGAPKGGSIFDALIYELGATAMVWNSGRFSPSISGGVDSMVRCSLAIEKWPSWWTRENAKSAGITSEMLHAAPPLAQVAQVWFTSICQAREKLPVVLAAHDAFNTDCKTLIHGLSANGVDVRRFFQDADVVGFLETRRLVKGLPDALLKRLKNHINSQPQGQKTKITLGSNRNIYETFVGGTQSEWHHAHVDASATAKWLASLEVTSQIPACLMPSMALIATEQVINMVEQKLHEAKLKKK